MKTDTIKTFEAIKKADRYPVELPRPARDAMANTYKRGADEIERRTGKRPTLPPWVERP